MSSETPDVESFLFTKDNINKYELDIDISSKPLKNKLIEVNTNLKFSFLSAIIILKISDTSITIYR